MSGWGRSRCEHFVLLQSSNAVYLIATHKQMTRDWQDPTFRPLVILCENDVNKRNVWIIWQRELAVNTLRPSGYYLYRTLVTICTAQWSLYVPHNGHYMYRTVVTICTTSLTLNNSTFSPHSVFMWFVWISEQTAIISLYNINWLVCITETEGVYCAVRTGSLYTASLTFSNSTFCPHSVFVCFVWIWEQTAIISLYSINWLVCITETECVYCAVRTGSLYTASLTFSNSTFCPHSVFMCFVWISEQTATISLYSIN